MFHKIDELLEEIQNLVCASIKWRLQQFIDHKESMSEDDPVDVKLDDETSFSLIHYSGGNPSNELVDVFDQIKRQVTSDIIHNKNEVRDFKERHRWKNFEVLNGNKESIKPHQYHFYIRDSSFLFKIYIESYVCKQSIEGYDILTRVKIKEHGLLA